MPYTYDVTGLTADLRELDEATSHDAAALINDIERADADLPYLEAALAQLAAMSPRLALALTAEGEEGDELTLRVRGGRVSRSDGADPAVLEERAVEMPPPGPLHQSLDEVKQLGRKRAAAPMDRLLALLGAAAGESGLARTVRREAYSALSWIETPPVRDVLLAGLRSEPDEVADTIAYVLWRQDAIVADLPRLLEEAKAAGNSELVGRLFQAQRGATA